MLDAVKAAAKALVAAVSPGDVPPEVKDGEEYYRKSLAEQKPHHPTWFMNVACFLGQQWLDWNGATGWLQQSAAPSWRVRLTTNLILPTLRTLIAKELESDPSFYGMPTQDSEEARGAARLATQLCEGWYYGEDFQNLYVRALHWRRCTGASYLWALWDPSRGREIEVPAKDEMGNPAIGEDGQPQTSTINEGDVHFDLSNSFETMLQPGGSENFSEHTRVMRAKFMDVQEIEDRWGVEVKPEARNNETTYLLRVQMLIDASGMRGGSAAENEATKNKALVKEYFELPTKQYPRGRHFMYANGTVIIPSEDLNYFYNGRRCLPVCEIMDIFIPGRAYRSGLVEHITPLNIQYNKLTSAAIESLNLLGKPKILSPEGCLDEDVFTNEPGEIVEYKQVPGGGRPEAFKPPEIPEYFFRVRDGLPSQLEDVSSVHEVSKGRLPRRANSGVAIKALQAGDDTPVGLSTRSLASGLSRLMSIALQQARENYSETRLVRKVGPNRQVELQNFLGTDLKDCDMVRVEIDHRMGRAEKQDIAMRLLEMGKISMQEAIQLLDTPDLNMIADNSGGERQYVDLENLNMAKGIAYPVGQFETHGMHIDGHTRFLNSPQGHQLPPEVQQIFQQHIAQHEALAMAQAKPPAAAGGPNLPQGAPPPPPEAEQAPGAGEGLVQ